MPDRNDLCPCGSGKKYKKCCMLKPLKRSIKVLSTGQPKETDLFQRAVDFYAGEHALKRQQAFQPTAHDYQLGKQSEVIPQNASPYVPAEEVSEAELQRRLQVEADGRQRAAETRSQHADRFEPTSEDFRL